MANHIEQYIELQEKVNRIVQGLAKRSGKPEEHVNSIWKATENEVVSKHKFGVTDDYKKIGNIVRSKLGVKADPSNPDEKDDDQEE